MGASRIDLPRIERAVREILLAIGEDPVRAMRIMVDGALGSTYGWGYTLFYTTNFLFTGLAVSIAFQALFQEV